jgi:DNA-binding NarL/FixJ family response regulator
MDYLIPSTARVSQSVAQRRYRVFVVDDRPLPRIAAKAMLAEADDLAYVGEAASGAEALELIPRLKPDVVLMDVDMPGLGGPEVSRQLSTSLPDLTILAWTVSDSTDDLLQMIQAGCVGYVLKEVGPEELRRAILAGINREGPFPRRMLPDVVHRAASQTTRPAGMDVSLTDRESEILKWLAKGVPTKKIATELGISRSSVDTHLRNVFRKLGVNNRGEAVNVGLRLGLLQVSDF